MTVLSELAVAMVRPSGLNATDYASLVWPVRVAQAGVADGVEACG